MKLVISHALPRKIDYLRLFANLGTASFYLSVDGKDVELFGAIRQSRSRDTSSFTDKEYHQYRKHHPVEKILMDDRGEVIVKTSDGGEEHWLKPKWFLRRRRLRGEAGYGR